MILKASQRSGGKQLGLHLLRTDENEHVEIHEVRGFVSESVLGAMQEAYALSRGTKCTQYLFSVSLNPPETETVRIETFENALDAIEERLGLAGQPRVVVFHEKEGRRHAHAVWSRIDAETMTAKQMSHFKMKLQDISRQLYLENGWKMPKGLVQRGMGDPRNFTLAEWQAAKRGGYDAKALKEIIQQCWSASDNRTSFESALEERGLFLAKGDRRSHVVVTFEGQIVSLPRMVHSNAKDVATRLGDAASLRTTAETLNFISEEIGVRLSEHIRIAKRNSKASLEPLLAQRNAMASLHRAEREKLDSGQRARWLQETTERASRLRDGFAGIWDRLTGDRAKTVKRNEMEAHFSLLRDRDQRAALVKAQLEERRSLQSSIKIKRREGATLVLALFADAAKFRSMKLGTSARIGRNFDRSARSKERPDRNTGRGFDFG